MLRGWRRVCAALLFVFATLWAGAILIAPRVVALGVEHPIWSDLGAVVYLAGGFICHQRPERSFHVAGVQYPVCARCTGIYLSAPLGVLLVLALRRGSAATAASTSASIYWRWRGLLVLAVLPTVVSILLERLGGPSGIVSRALAAIPLGVGAAAFVTAAILGQFAQDFTGRRGGIAGPRSGV